MRRIPRLLAASVVLTLVAKPVDAQAPPPYVREFAPIVWLADAEPVRPALPWPYAFDDVDNDRDGLCDVADVQEIAAGWGQVRGLAACQAPSDPAETGPPRCWSTARAEGDGCEQGGGAAPTGLRPRSRVLYAPPVRFAGWGVGPAPGGSACDDDAPFRVEARPRTEATRVLRKGEVVSCAARESPAPVDRTRWLRVVDTDDGALALVGPRDLQQMYVGKTPPPIGSDLLLLQYWLYFPADLGPNSHAHDAEHVSLFVERTRSEAGWHDSLKGMVGVGHEQDSVNNILVRGHDGSQALFPTIERHTPALVELGKHATAPDQNCTGRFDLGADANIYPEAVWGSRDVWAGNVGKALKVGDFEPWFSFPRTAKGRIFEESWRDDAGYSVVCDDLADDADQQPVETFQLFPIETLKALYALLGEPGVTAAAVDAFLQTHVDEFWPGRTSAPGLGSPAPLARMKEVWLDPRDPHTDRWQVWRHGFYRNPDDIFRKWLFNRWGLGVSVKGESGNFVTGAVLRISEIPLPGWVPFVGGSQALHDSRIELFAHFDGLGRRGDQRGLFDAGINVFSGRGRHVGWYLGGGYQRDLNKKVGLNAGVEFGMPSLKLLKHGSVMGFIGATGGLFRANAEEAAGSGSAAPRQASNVSIQYGIRLVIGFGRPRHPLSY